MKKFFDYCIYSLAILLAFLLVFERFLELPNLISWLGHWHPLILHFPIVLILVTVVQYWRRDLNISWYLSITTFLTLISAITGLILSLEGGTKGNLIITHQWMGVAVSMIMVFWYFLNQSISRGKIKILQGALVLLIVLTGHFGGTVTHGQDFLSFGSSNDNVSISLLDDPNIYLHIVQPVLDKKCTSCHNENKAKGELVLTNFAGITSGGKSGSAVDAQSGILGRINLPLEHEEHMPPPDEQQLDEEEVIILQTWLDQGASENMRFNELDRTSDLYKIIDQRIQESKSSLWADLPKISNEEIVDYASDYCTIRRIYNGSNALEVLIFPHESFSTVELQDLNDLSKNIVDLTLSNLPLSEKDFKIINSFEVLEFLDLSGTTVANENLKVLNNLKKLKTLKLYNTQLSDEASSAFGLFPDLTDLYLYETNFSTLEIQELRRRFANLNIVTRSEIADEFKSVLPSPVLEPARIFFRDPFYVKLNHPLKGIDIRYTVDSNNPDNNSLILKDSLLVRSNHKFKYYASKNGWESSPMDSIQFIESSIKPSVFELENAPDQKYLGVGKFLLFDLEKGSANFGDDAWMAFKDHPFVLTCEFEEKTTIRNVILSSMINTDPYIFPPSKISVFGGDSPDKLSFLGSLSPKEPRERIGQHFEFYKIDLNPRSLKFIKIDVTPLKRIPMWHQGKGERGWFFIDEVVFISESAI